MIHYTNRSTDNIDGEEWKPIANFPFYMVSSLGRVKRIRRIFNRVVVSEKILSQTLNGGKYLSVCIKKESYQEHVRKNVHRIVALAFIPNPYNKKTVNHKFGNKLDNRVSELEWATSKEQDHHARKTGLKIAINGDRCSWSKLSEKEVMDIYKSELSVTKLSIKYGINVSHICGIKKGRCRSSITGHKYHKKELSEISIINIFKSKLSLRKLATMYGYKSNNPIRRIKQGAYSAITGKL